MKKTLLALATLFTAGSAMAVGYNSVTTPAVGTFDFAVNNFGVSTAMANGNATIECSEGDVLLDLNMAGCADGNTFRYDDAKKSLVLSEGMALEFYFVDVAEQDQTIRGIKLVLAEGSDLPICDSEGVSYSADGLTLNYTVNDPKPLTHYNFSVGVGKTVTISNIVVDFTYEAEIASIWGAEWQMVTLMGAADMNTTFTTATEGDYTLYYGKYYTSDVFAFKHNGKYYLVPASEVVLNDPNGLELTAYDKFPSQSEMMYLNKNAQNVEFKIVAPEDGSAPKLYVAGEELVETPGGEFAKFTITVGDKTVDMTTENGKYYYATFAEVKSDVAIYITNNGKNYSNEGILTFNGEYGAPLMWVETDPVMHLDKDATNVVFRLDASWGIDMLTLLAYKGTSSGVEGVEAEEEAVYYTLDGVKVAGDEPGLYIVVKGGKAVKVVK